jgi:hypothetical protein
VMLDRGELKLQGTPATLQSTDGEHLDFLDGSFDSRNNFIITSSSFQANGKYFNRPRFNQ